MGRRRETVGASGSCGAFLVTDVEFLQVLALCVLGVVCEDLGGIRTVVVERRPSEVVGNGRIFNMRKAKCRLDFSFNQFVDNTKQLIYAVATTVGLLKFVVA